MSQAAVETCLDNRPATDSRDAGVHHIRSPRFDPAHRQADAPHVPGCAIDSTAAHRVAIHVPSANASDSPNPAIAVRLDPAPDTALARYGLEHVLSILGLRPTEGEWTEPTIYRGHDPAIGRRAALWMAPHEPEARRARTGKSAEYRPCFDIAEFDIPLAAARWLTLDAERRIASRDAHGRVRAAESEIARLGALNDPPLAHYAALLKARLDAAGVRLRPRPIWPHDKRFAVALTHDVDQPERPLRLSAVWRALRNAADKSGQAGGYDFEKAGRRSDFWPRLLLPPTKRSDWDFDAWLDVEAACGLRSAFYFTTTSRRNRHALDPDYDIARRRYRTLFERLNTGGWEVGLHASYDAINGRPSVVLQRARLAQWAGSSIAGARHHFLNVRRDDPIDTLRQHANAGMIYDSSLGFNDAPGFRCGTAWPFRPFVPAAMAPCRFVELPLTLADMHLPADDVCAAVKIVMNHLLTIGRLGGLAVLDWHVGHWHACPAWRESYRVACRWLAAQPDAWVAPPRDIAAWWRINTLGIAA